jgi:hypothetical protein
MDSDVQAKSTLTALFCRHTQLRGHVRMFLLLLACAEPVMSLALEPANKSGLDKFSKALQRFMREDPTFRVGFDAETKQTIIRLLASPTIPPKPQISPMTPCILDDANQCRIEPSRLKFP